MSQQWRDRIGKTQGRATGPRFRLAVLVIVVLATGWLMLAERSPLHGLLQHLTR